MTLVRFAPGTAVPVALIILADGKGADCREMPEGETRFFRPGVELLLDELKVALGGRRLRNIEAGVAQAGDHVLRGHEAVEAQKPQQSLAGVTTVPAAALGQEFEQADPVGGRPAREELAKAA